MLFLNQDKFDDETRAVLQRALDIFLLNFGPDAENVGIVNHLVANFRYKKGEYVQAKRFCKEALRIYLHQGLCARASRDSQRERKTLAANEI